MKFLKDNFVIIIAIIVLSVSSLIYDSTWFSYITAIFGIIYVFLIGKKKWYGYIFGILNTLMYAYTLYTQGMTLSVLYYTLYSFPVLLIGLFYWKRSKVKKEKVLPRGVYALLLIFILLTVIGIISFTNQKWFYDLVTTLYGSIALILMARNYKEQWITWSFANLVGTLLWMGVFVKGIYDTSLFLMWAMYLLNSIFFLLKPDETTKK